MNGSRILHRIDIALVPVRAVSRLRHSIKAHAIPLSETLLDAFAPTGVLRGSINLGNPVLAHRDAASGAPGGVSVDLTRELASRFGVGIALSAFDTAAQSVETVTHERADVGFFAIDPLPVARESRSPRRLMC